MASTTGGANQAGSAAIPSGAGGSGTPTPSGGSAQLGVGASGGAGMAGASAGGTSAGGANAGGTGGSAGAAGGSGVSALPQRVLLYHFSTLVIDSVPAQLTLLTNVLQGWGYEVEVSDAPSAITATHLAKFGGVGMINTCFEPFGVGNTGAAETAALEQFVAAGGGLFGTHCASVTFQSAEPPNHYNEVIGGRGGHGFFDGVSSCRTIEQHPTSAMLPASFDFSGNLDNADFLAPDSKVLVKCTWSGGDKKDSAVSWYRTPGKGRVFYTNFGKVNADLSSEMLGAQHIILGLGWVLGR